MQKLYGAGLILLGGFLFYLFGVNGVVASYNPDVPAGEQTIGTFAPFQALGKNYPADVFCLFFGIAASVIGLVIMFRRMGVKETQTPRVARALLVNSVLLIIFILSAYIGAKADADAKDVGVFTIVTVLQIVVGIVLLIGALRHPKKTNPSTILGSFLFVSGTAIVVLSFVFGKG